MGGSPKFVKDETSNNPLLPANLFETIGSDKDSNADKLSVDVAAFEAKTSKTSNTKADFDTPEKQSLQEDYNEIEGPKPSRKRRQETPRTSKRVLRSNKKMQTHCHK